MSNYRILDVEVKAIIKFRNDYVLEFENECKFVDKQAEIAISAIQNGLTISFKFKGINNLNHVLGIAEQKLLVFTNRLSWLENIPIEESKVIGHSFTEIKGYNKVIHLSDSVSLSSSLSFAKKLGSIRINELARLLPSNYSPEADEILIMWRDALRESSPVVKTFLLYRLLEMIFGTRRAVDDWIKSNYPLTELRKDRNKVDDITIYTFLRDNVHAKSINFPFEEFKTNLPQLQNIAQSAIRRKFKI